MSQIELILVDSHRTLRGNAHTELGERCIAALTAEPETIEELETAVQRFQTKAPEFLSRLDRCSTIDTGRSDLDSLIIDLSSRLIVSRYAQTNIEGQVSYYDDDDDEPVTIPYRLSDDWLCVGCLEQYLELRQTRRCERQVFQRINTRAVLYGRPLLEFVARNASSSTLRLHSEQGSDHGCLREVGLLTEIITDLHEKWLTTTRNDLLSRSPRDVMLSKRRAIDFDMTSRMLQWTAQLQGPACLARDSAAYRLAGFGIHEWIIYYGMVRFLLSKALHYCLERQWSQGLTLDQLTQCFDVEDLGWRRPPHGVLDRQKVTSYSDVPPGDEPLETLIDHLEHWKILWLTEPNAELGQRVPFFVIDNERKRLPEATILESISIDEDCPCCLNLIDESMSMGEVSFWHLDPSGIEDEFAFSTVLDFEEWRAERSSVGKRLRSSAIDFESLEQLVRGGDSAQKGLDTSSDSDANADLETPDS